MRLRLLALLVVMLSLGFMLGVIASPGRWLARSPNVAAPALPVAATPAAFVQTGRQPVPPGLEPDEERTIEVFRSASRSVVFIHSRARGRDLFLRPAQVDRGSGSGFVWDDQGHIVTNFHVVQGANEFLVTLADQSEWEGRLVGVADDKDLAVLRIDAPRDKLVPLFRGRSDGLVVGQKVLAIGNPFGLDQSLTVGVLSALGRELESPGGRVIRDVIQTDAAINPGNSGGPLLDSSGRLIGVNTAIYSPSGASAGIGFAVPVDIVSRLVPQLIRHGRPIMPGIGVAILNDSITRNYGIKGVVISSVVAGSPAERAGLEGLRRDRRGRLLLGDLIVAVNGKPVLNSSDLQDHFEALGIGARATLTVERDRQRREVEVNLVQIQ